MEQVDCLQPIKVGDKFKTGSHLKAEVVDIVKTYSTVENKWIGVIYMAKGIGAFSQNTFEVPKSTIVRHRFIETENNLKTKKSKI